MKIAAAEDDRKCRNDLIDKLQQYGERHDTPMTIDAYDNGVDIAEMAGNGYDLIMLDILIPMLNGIDAARAIRRIDTDVTLSLNPKTASAYGP